MPEALPHIRGVRSGGESHRRFAIADNVPEYGEIKQPDLHDSHFMAARNFEASMRVGEALDRHPHARWVFAAYHIGGCDGCSRVGDETLAEVADAYRLPLDRLLADLNALL